MKKITSAALCVIGIFFIACQKESGTDPETNKISSAVSSDAFLPASVNSPQHDVIARLKSDPDVKAFVKKAETVFSFVRWTADTARHNAIIQSQLTPSIEAVRARWSRYLNQRFDKNAIIIAGVEGAFSPLPMPASQFGPCDDQRKRDERKCNRSLALDAALCTFAWAGGPASYGGCLIGVGAKGLLCFYEADSDYNDCRSTPARLGVQQFGNWIWTPNGWRYTPLLTPLNP